MENRFESRNEDLIINGKKVLHGWESFDGWYWFAVKKVKERVSVINGRPVKDTIWFGFVQGQVDEWGYFSQAEMESYSRNQAIPHYFRPLRFQPLSPDYS